MDANEKDAAWFLGFVALLCMACFGAVGVALYSLNH